MGYPKSSTSDLSELEVNFKNSEKSVNIELSESSKAIKMCTEPVNDNKDDCKNRTQYHPYISYRFRSTLFAWLMQICDRFKCRSETFEAAIIIINNCVNQDNEYNLIDDDNLDMIAVTCLWIAIKCNDNECIIPSSKELVDVIGKDYSNNEIFSTEYKILESLNWDVYHKTPSHYVETLAIEFEIVDIINKSKEAYDKIYNLLDMTYLEHKFSKFSPKIIVSSILKILYELDLGNIDNKNEIDDCVTQIIKFCINNITCVCLSTDNKSRKYYHQRYYNCKKIIDKQQDYVSKLVKREIARDILCKRISCKYYELVEICGEGTYSIVYKATVKDTGKLITVKEYKENKTDLYGIHPSTICEIAILKKCNHTNIILMSDILFRKNKICITYDYCDSTLFDKLNRSKLDKSQIKRYMYQLLLALDYLYDRNIIHADIKPQNILIKNDQVKICDFNCSRISDISIKLPQMVTLWYRPPEILFGSTEYGTEIDIWSSGCILAEMYKGSVLFSGTSTVDQIFKILKTFGSPSEDSELTKLPEYEPIYSTYSGNGIKINDECDDLILKMLKVEPVKRISVKDALKHNYFMDINL